MTEETVSMLRHQMNAALKQRDFAEFWSIYDFSEIARTSKAWLVDACTDGRQEIVDGLLARNVDPNQRSNFSTRTSAVGAACSNGRAEIVSLLLNANADISVESIDDNCLFGAIYSRSLAIAKLLIEAGIDIHKTYDVSPTRRKNALLYAEEWGCKDIADLLRAHGATLPVQPVKVLLANERRDAIEQVLSHFFETEKVESFQQFSLGATSKPDLLEILRIDAEPSFPFQTFATIGVSAHAVPIMDFSESEVRIEFLMHLPLTWLLKSPNFSAPEYGWPLEWLKAIAKNVVSGVIRLNGAHNILSNGEPAEPLGAGTDQTCMLLMSDFYDFSPTDIGDGKPLHFVHLVPLYIEEREFEKRHGMQPLLEAMATKGLESLVVRPDRERFI